MGRKKTLALLVAAAFALPIPASAAGLGRLTVFSGLGQPLRAEIEVVSLQRGEAETLAARLAPVEAYQQANVDFSPALQSLRFNVERRQNNRYVITMTSVAPVNDPFLDVLVELSWASGRLVREYTFLLDPQEYKGPQVEAQVAPPAAAPAAPGAAAKPEPARPDASPSRAEATQKPAAPSAPAASSLAAAPAAAPAASAGSGQGSTYEVKTGDSLAKIAQATMPAGVTLQQMLVAVYRANEDAFINKNMNLLRSGRILQIPAAEQVRSVTAAEAGQVVRAQVQEWNAYRNQLAGAAAAAPARAEGGGQVAGGRINAQVQDGAPSRSDRLQIAQADGKGGAAAGRAAQGDNAVANERALREAQDRIQMLEQNVRTMAQQLELKNQELARLQAQSKGGTAPVAPQKPQPPVVAEVKPPAAEPTPPQPPVVAETKPAPAEPPKAEPPKVEPPVVAEAKPPAPQPPQPAPEAKAAPKPAPAPMPVAEPSLLDQIIEGVMENIALIGAGLVAILAAIFGLRFMRKRKSEQIEDSLMGTAQGEASSVFGSSGGRSIDTGSSLQTDFSQSGIGAIDTDEVDPVAEADVYMAYGRDAQAEEILREALQKDPNRHAVRVKLLEIYAARKDVKAFETTAGELYAATSGQGPDWERAAALGAQVDPANPMYGGKAGAPMAAAAAAAVAAAPVAPPMPDINLGSPSGGSAPSVLDFNLDSSLKSQVPQPTEVPHEAVASAAPSDLGFDLNLGEPSVLKQPSVGNPFSPPSMAPASLVPELEIPGGASAPRGENVVEFDIGAAAKPSVDLGAISLDLGTPSAAGAPVDSRWQEVATKLDLAKAYHEMGDREGARELLSEVLKEGDGAQQQQAKKMLETIG